MEKLLTATMKNPTAANKAKLIAHANNHPMSVCLLSADKLAILDQYVRESN